MRQKHVTVNGKEVTYYESRDNGKAVVLVHGISSCSSIFIRQLIDSVLSYQFRFIAPDLIGYGKSEQSNNPEQDYSIQGQSKFLLDFCNTLQIKDAVFIGHDIGGNIILESFKNHNNPKGLVLLGSVPFSKPFTKKVFKDENVYELISKHGIDSSEVHQTASLFVQEDTKYPDFIPEIIRKADSRTRELFFNSVIQENYKDQIEQLKSIAVPIAAYIGESDQMISKDYLEKIEIPTLWKERIQEIKDAGHMFFYESPADFNISFESFLNTIFK